MKKFILFSIVVMSSIAQADTRIFKQYHWGMSKSQVAELGAGRCKDAMCARTRFVGTNFNVYLVFKPWGLHEVRLLSDQPQTILKLMQTFAGNNYDQIMVSSNNKNVDIIEGLTQAKTEVFDNAKKTIDRGYSAGDLSIMYMDHRSVAYALKNKMRSASQVMLVAPHYSRFARIDVEGQILQVIFSRPGLDANQILGTEKF